ncbi:MAG: SPOR domain-containing protein, partial [Sphingobacteriia bacterium]
SLRKPSVHIQQDTAIDIGLRQYANPYRTLGSGIVYRVQIYNGDREKASLAQFDFMELRTGQPVYMEFDQPNFKVRVGNFKTEQEAKTFVKDVQLHFPSAFVVPCQLTPER